jgi:hypothetical protein
MATNKNSDNKSATDPFYPEDAQKHNFDDARRTAAANHEKDQASRQLGSDSPSRVVNAKGMEVVNPVAAPGGVVPYGTEAAKGDSKDVGETDESNKPGGTGSVPSNEAK